MKDSADYMAARVRARKAGDTTFEGRPCRKCQNTERYVSAEGCVRCGRIKSRRRYYSDLSASRQKCRDYARSRPEYMLWQAARVRARAKGREFSIEPRHVEIPAICPVLGMPMESPSIDRWDNAKGYTVDNIRVISKKANFLKSNATVEEVEAILRYMRGEVHPARFINRNNQLLLRAALLI